MNRLRWRGERKAAAVRANGDVIYGTSRSPFPYLSWGVATRKGSTLYLHVFDWSKDGTLRVPLNNQAKSATVLATGRQLTVTSGNGRLAIEVPAIALGHGGLRHRFGNRG